MERKLDLGKALSDGFSIWSRNILRFATIGAAVFVPLMVLYIVLNAVLPSLLAFLPNQIASVVGGAVLAGMLAVAISEARAGQPDRSVGDLFDVVRPRLPNLVVASLLVGLVVGVGLILCIIPGIIANVLLAFTSVIVALEGLAPVDAMKSSRERVRGNELMLFVLILIVAIGTGIVSVIAGVVLAIVLVAVLGLPTWLFGALVLVAVGAFVTPLTSSMLVSAYLQLTEPWQGAGLEHGAAPPMQPGGPSVPPTSTPPSGHDGPFS